MKPIVAPIALVFTLSSVSLGAEERQLGAGVSLTDATTINAVLERPRDFVGKTIRIDGVATAVCTHMGCWMAVAPEGADASRTIRLKVDDGVIVFPASAKGRKVSAQGVFEVVGKDQESREAAGEHKKQDANASQDYQIKATGAVIR